ncbi:hypothetical protein BST81_21375 [Leptolyngbya sp. 'hensonii']|uniref:cupin domain-containing protein n=1 Tax=Leptolyngbya sp. 'hensonii' TaxID=1922337 RepID=UPI0009500C24|nr:cupin domain-containing protein [Leptolyngbya sp. 'hensonii']OLP16346.1 hypothetical protein BST81_21375 [Leptolyngbya sp. 'hensonii']
MNSSNLPADDQAPPPSPADRLLQLELQEGIGKLFYASCDPTTHDLLSKCQWGFRASNTGLTLEICCSDAGIYQTIHQMKTQMIQVLKALFIEDPQIHIDLPAQPAAPIAPTPAFFQATISCSLAEQITYRDQDIHQVPLAKDQRGQFSLICISAGDDIPTHSTTQGTAIYVLEGQGKLEQGGQPISLQPGSFAYVPPKTTHTLKAIENLALLCAWI